LTADQDELNDTDALIVLSTGKGAAAYLTRRLGADALGILEDALNQHGETYAYQTTQIWQGRTETIIQFLVPQLRVRLRAIKRQTDGSSGHGYFFVIAAERITKAETYEAWAHPIHRAVIVLRENEHEITRCGICTRPLPNSGGDVEKCPYCLHEYKDDTAIVKVETEPVPVIAQFDVAALTPEKELQASRFGIAFHPEAYKRFCQLQPEEQATIGARLTATLAGCTYGRLQLRSGACIIISRSLPNIRDNSQDVRTKLDQLDNGLRETGMGYLLDAYELRKAQAKADDWSKAKTH
jgi:hypothetical protein